MLRALARQNRSMAFERSKGIVLRTRPLTETSLIVQWLTPELGRIATVAKGARRPKSSFRGQIDLFYTAEFSFMRSARSQLHTLREVSLLETHAILRRDMEHLEQASYCAKLIEQATETETPLPILFDTFSSLLKEMSGQQAQPQTIFAFEIKLLNELGLNPDQAESHLSAGSKQILVKLGELDWPSISRFKLSLPQIAELRQFLQGFIICHLERIPGGRNRALGEWHKTD